ncbi:IclR family transcriptional regulator [Nocardioides coralli]|uniref:IclR family transcriptional regulator n=1 Tax=Nocardioides coralli TaxID=2872154 RepID=UPI001CA3F5A5|nr:IclR family transcriptional regulator [Nocardioides coralli]QZY29913.1 IclR family transcriptional regulator [Nocardioides coralli]
MTLAAERPNGGVQSVDRAITILEILARLGEAGVTEVAGELGVHKSTAFRLIGTMEARGLVEQADDRGKYRIGLGLVKMAGASAARTDLVQVARPSCKALAAETHETVNLAVLADGTALYLDQIAGAAALQPHNWIGQRIPLHATSNGKVLIADLEPDLVDELVPRLTRHAEATITDRASLHRELARVREQGYAVAVDELEEGLTALAAAIRDAHGDVVASLSVSGTTFRLDEATRTELVPPLLRAAEEVSLALGWVPPREPAATDG